MSTLQDYLTATQRLLHDSQFKYWTQATMVDAINGACNRVVGDSGCNRQLQVFPLNAGQETYTYGSVVNVTVNSGGSLYDGFTSVEFDAPTGPNPVQATAIPTVVGGVVTAVTITNPGSGYIVTPSCYIVDHGGGSNASATAQVFNFNTLDVMNVTVLWGSERVILNRMAFTQLQATVRSWLGYTQRPGYLSSYGQNTWYIGPIPDQTYTSEWDTIVTPTALVNTTDISVIGYPFNECVAYYAAHICKFQEQSYAESDKFLEVYTRKMMYARRSVMMRMLPSAYG